VCEEIFHLLSSTRFAGASQQSREIATFRKIAVIKLMVVREQKNNPDKKPKLNDAPAFLFFHDAPPDPLPI
jgi:hypothetical protein